MKIQGKLFSALLLTCLVLVVSLFVLMRGSIHQGMLEYINSRNIDHLKNASQQLAILYQQNNSWDFLTSSRRDWPDIVRRLIHTSDRHEHKHNKQHGPPPVRLAILDANKDTLVGRYRPDRPNFLIAITSQQQTIGWLAYPKRKDILDGFELHFIEKQRKALAIICLVVLLLATAVAYLLSRHFVRPIKAIAKGAHQLTQGNYQTRIDADRRDEFGGLARDFNELATTIGNNDQARKRWLADTSHELRTPISILKGELEAMLDGVRAIDEKSIRSAHEEVEQLRVLVDDLYELSNADIGALRYRKECVDLNEILAITQHAFQHQVQQAGLQIQINAPENAVEIWADYGRIKQLVANIISNACKYTDSGGQIIISLTTHADSAKLLIEDSAPGVPSDSYKKLFDHLYRVESSRNRATGGSGLGLAICERIVHAHQGTIKAAQSSLGGVAISIELPLMKAPA